MHRTETPGINNMAYIKTRRNSLIIDLLQEATKKVHIKISVNWRRRFNICRPYHTN